MDRDSVAKRAYEIYERRGRSSGRELDDWLQAERELQAASSQAGPGDRQASEPEPVTAGVSHDKTAPRRAPRKKPAPR